MGLHLCPDTVEFLPTNAFLPCLSISWGGERSGDSGSHFPSRILYLASGIDETRW